MRLSLLLLSGIAIASCDSSSGSKAIDSYPPVIANPPLRPNPTPLPEPNPEEEIISRYEPDFFPLTAWMVELKKSEVSIVDDYFKFQQGLVLNWGESRYSEHTPSEFLSLWNPDEIKYVDDTGGKVKGIEKLESIRQAMLLRCPSLTLPEHNAPIEIHWDETELERGGEYKATSIFLTEDVEYLPELKYSTVYNGGLFPWLNQAMWIYGKQPSWDYPNQTTVEIGKPWGIDETFVHEWGHHLAYAIDVNLGRTSYQTWQFTESFAESVRYACFGSHLDKPEILESEYQSLLWDVGGDHKILKNPIPDPPRGMQYSIRSMEQCITHEMYHGKFEPDDFLQALIEAYKRVDGRKLDPNPYPVYFQDSGYAQAPWVGSGYQDNHRLTQHQPLLVTRAEFLERFLEVYDCGLANEFIEADIEGMLKFEW